VVAAIAATFDKKYRMKKLILPLLLLCSSFVMAQTELPAIAAANRAAFFIPQKACNKYKLEPARGDAWMRVYNNMGESATVQRVNDIRWQATNKNAALAWYKANYRLLSEGGQEVEDGLPDMMDAMGVKQEQYTFTFVVDKYVGKIFVGAAEGQTLEQVWQFAKEGVKATLKAAGKPKLAALIL
jgi:predicted urease superfamily metal-dependent hydrolase